MGLSVRKSFTEHLHCATYYTHIISLKPHKNKYFSSAYCQILSTLHFQLIQSLQQLDEVVTLILPI